MVMAEYREPDLISIPEAMKRFNVRRNTLKSALKRGTIRRYEREIGKERIFVDAREVEMKLRPRLVDGGSDQT